MRRTRRLLLFVALATLPLAAVLPLAAQTPTPGPGTGSTPSATPPAGATPGPAPTAPTASAIPAAAATPNPLAPYNPFLLAAILQQSDLPAGDIIVLQAPAGPDDLSDDVMSLNVTVDVAFLQLFAPLSELEGGTSPLAAILGPIAGGSFGADAIYVLGSAQDASTLLGALKQSSALLGNDSDLSKVQAVQPPALGDEALEFTAVETSTDPDTGETTTANLAFEGVRRGRVVSLAETASSGDPRAATEAVAAALDARIQMALPLLPAQ